MAKRMNDNGKNWKIQEKKVHFIEREQEPFSDVLETIHTIDKINRKIKEEIVQETDTGG